MAADGGGFDSFPDTNKNKRESKRDSRRESEFKIKQKEYSNRYYIEVGDNTEMSYSYFHSRIKDKLVWYQDIEKLLPPTIPGQFIYALLNLIFPSNLYYSFHRYEFENGFKTEHRMDDFFTSRRVLSIQEKVPGIFPSLLWYKIIKYEPTPYKSMCYYQYIRQNDADQIYKLPIFFGYTQMILTCILTFVFCETIPDNIQFFNFHYNIFINNNNMNLFDKFLFKPLSMVNIFCYLLIVINSIHIICILIVWRITYFLHIKIYDYKKRIFLYLSRRRSKEIQFIESLFVGNKSKINRESKYRIYYKINPQSYLYFKRNGELFISLLKWLNIIEHEQDLDFFITSKKNWFIITFALHKYIGLIIFNIIILFGVNIITLFIIFMYFISYWMHCIEVYTSDHHNINSKVNQEYKDNPLCKTLCQTLLKLIKILLWPGILVYITLSYCIYIIFFHNEYFPVIWLGVGPIFLIIYSVLTRGYRRIYIPNGLAAFFIYFVSINWFIFRNYEIKGYQYIFRYLTAVFCILFLFSFYMSIQLEIHRAMLFPQLSGEYKRDETVQHKFGLDVTGAKLYTFAQYAAMYYKKNISKRGYNKGFHNHYKWYEKWYIQLPLQGLFVAKPKYPFVAPCSRS